MKDGDLGIHTVGEQRVAPLLRRKRRLGNEPHAVPMMKIFQDTLKVANRFVPSEAGSILLDDPMQKMTSPRQDNELIFVACFGEKADSLVGSRIPCSQGIVGHCYMSGEAYMTSNVREDRFFMSDIDEITRYRTKALLAVPIKVEKATVGVLELVNHRSRGVFVEHDFDLLKTFADYIATSLQNFLDATSFVELAHRDHLTGLYNDRYLWWSLGEEIVKADGSGQDASLIFVDLDHFKSVNDTHGHLVGSQTLREFGLLLDRMPALREAVTARYGGDEFAILVPGIGLDEASAIAEDIRRQVEHFVFEIPPETDVSEDGVRLENVITTSIGVASYRESGVDGLPEEQRRKAFMQVADRAMYAAKAKGKNAVCRGIAIGGDAKKDASGAA